MEKVKFVFLSVLFLFFIAFYPASSMAFDLPLITAYQLQKNWCWAGSTQALLNTLGKSAKQCDMATHLAKARNFLFYGDCCAYTTWSLPDDHICNNGNNLYEYSGNIKEIMSTKYSTQSVSVGTHLDAATVKYEIDGGRPFLFRWTFKPGSLRSGSHILVGSGITGNYMRYMDPDPSTSRMNLDYHYVVVEDNEHKWDQTLKSSVSMLPPKPDIRANGRSANFSVPSSQAVDVTVSLDAQQYTNAETEYWIAGYLNGLLYYCYYDLLAKQWLWTTEKRPAASGKMASFSPFSVFNYPIGPPGTSITFFFMVDFNKNNSFEDNPAYYDSITVTSY